MNKYLTLMIAIFLNIGSFWYQVYADCTMPNNNCFHPNDLAPWRYRVLVPVFESFAPFGSHGAVFFLDFALQIALTILITIGLYRWLKRWTSDDRALIGCLLFSMVAMVSYQFYMLSLASTIEMACVVWALVWIEGSMLRYAALVAIAALNRETGLLLPVIYLFYHWKVLKSPSRVGLALIAEWFVITAFIHALRGYAPHILGNVFTGTLEYNLKWLQDGIIAVIPLMPLFIALIVTYKPSPTTLKRLVWVAMFYCSAMLAGAAWSEIQRLILPALVLTLPVMLYQPVNESKWAKEIQWVQVPKEFRTIEGETVVK